MQLRRRQSFVFTSAPSIRSWACAVGKKEGKGPLKNDFDLVLSDDQAGEPSWEKAESALQKMALERALSKGGLTADDLNLICGGDLLNQCIGTSYAMRDMRIPFLGLYGACSTMAESLIVSGMAISGGAVKKAAGITSSHFASAERQYRFPLVYGGQRTPTAQWTATASGCVILEQDGPGPYLRAATVGCITDWGITDANNMGAAMAPAAYQTIRTHLEEFNLTPEDYDLIVTGDLGYLGRSVVQDLFAKDGLNLDDRYDDCGTLLFDAARQDVHAGASGCGCSAAVLCAKLLPMMKEGKLRRLLFCGTGALLSPLTTQQGESVPAICHAVSICTNKEDTWIT
ncbi:MAG: stage V sporulation protein AD [Ruminococcaceae bacterium]|nr:stage V sporulation protein AD [Oscillospiraceae bacterium]